MDTKTVVNTNLTVFAAELMELAVQGYKLNDVVTAGPFMYEAIVSKEEPKRRTGKQQNEG